MWIVSFTNKCINQKTAYISKGNGSTVSKRYAHKYPKKIWADNAAETLRRSGWLYVEVIEVPR